MGMGMSVSFQYPMSIGTSMGMIFENGYECGYSLTRLIAIRNDNVLYFGGPSTKICQTLNLNIHSPIY